MKISILTFSKELNNGAVLQCYALCLFLKSLGHNVSVIDIQLRSCKSFKSKVLDIYQWFLFRKFYKKYIPFSKKVKRISDLKLVNTDSDLFIVGSDQVWNPDITRRLSPEVYFFNFLPDNVKRISYAASFGTDVWKWEAIKDNIKELLHKFAYISVRERSGVDICKVSFGVDATYVCDPTILLENYDEICGMYDTSKQNNDLLYFKIIRNNRLEEDVLSFAIQKGMTAHSIRDRRKKKGFKYTPYTTVPMWLNLIRYSSFVVTDSFHATVFCILFHKQFLALPSQPDRSSRHLDLLTELGLKSRFCSRIDRAMDALEFCHSTPIDYNIVDERLNSLRKHSINYLLKAIGDL